MKFSKSSCLCYAVILISSFSSKGQSTPILKTFEKGKYEVGFRTLWMADSSRIYVLKNEDEAESVKFPVRPVLINIWFPAKFVKGQPMKTKDYLEIDFPGTQFSIFAKKLKSFNTDIIVNELLGKNESELNEKEKNHLETYFIFETSAYKEAAFRKKKFPLIIYHSGAQSSFEDNSILCEYLASFGYIVISSAYQKEDGSTLATDNGIGSIRDIDFLIDFARKKLPVHSNKIALVGHSAGAQTILKLPTVSKHKIATAICLETTQEYHSIYNKLWTFTDIVLENTPKFNFPLLMVAGPSAIFDLTDHLKYSKRLYLTIDSLNHNEFISQGIYRQKLLAYDDSIKSNYQLVCNNYFLLNNYIAAFLEHILKKKSGSFNKLTCNLTKTSIESMVHLEIMQPGIVLPHGYSYYSHPPTPREFRLFMLSKNIDSAINLLTKWKTAELKYRIYDRVYGYALIYECLAKNDIAKAKALYKFYESIYNEELLGTFRFYCRIGGLLQKKNYTTDCYDKLLILEPEDPEVIEELKKIKM